MGLGRWKVTKDSFSVGSVTFHKNPFTLIPMRGFLGLAVQVPDPEDRGGSLTGIFLLIPLATRQHLKKNLQCS
jgi:hypothetical protein